MFFRLIQVYFTQRIIVQLFFQIFFFWPIFFFLKLEKEAMKDVVLKAIEEERKNLEKAHAEERELWKTEHAKDQEEVSQAIQKAIQEQRKISQVSKI